MQHEEPETNSLFGIVRITDSEVLLEGVRVWVEGVDEDHTTPNGGYALDGFDLGIVTVLAELDGHEQYSRRVRIDPGGNVHDIFLIPITPPATLRHPSGSEHPRSGLRPHPHQ